MESSFLIWAGSASLTGLSVVLWWIAKRFWTKLDTIEHQLQLELRFMDVRISMIEVHLGLENHDRVTANRIQ